jgi:hypothetical protein
MKSLCFPAILVAGLFVSAVSAEPFGTPTYFTGGGAPAYGYTGGAAQGYGCCETAPSCCDNA